MSDNDTIKTNYNTDVQLLISLQDTVTGFDADFNKKAYQTVQNKKRQAEIDKYYESMYQKQILLMKKAVFLACLAILGCVLLQNNFMSEKFFVLFEALILSAGFIIIMYDLWDIYLRDNSIFDEYDFSVYLDPHINNGHVDSSFNSVQLAYQPVGC